MLLLSVVLADEEEEEEDPAVKRANIFGSHHALRSQFGSIVVHNVSHNHLPHHPTGVYVSRLSGLPPVAHSLPCTKAARTLLPV